MSDSSDSATKELLDAGVELVKTAYGDALQPAAKEVGQALGLVGKAVNMALSPLALFVWSYETIKEYVIKAVNDNLEGRNVPPERIRTPNADIAVPALEALRYSNLRENFARLIATSMDSETASYAHPAYVEILKQLTPDEAKILAFIPPYGSAVPILDVIFDHPDFGRFVVGRNFSTIGIDASCEHPESAQNYVDNLCRLGLTEIPVMRRFKNDSHYERLIASPDVEYAKRQTPVGYTARLERKMLAVTIFGAWFKFGCIGGDKPGSNKLPPPNES